MKNSELGFTLIELSIVLVIIGLLVGGVLVGQDLIRAAAIRAQITQIEKFKTATNTFYVKYGYLPGDIPAVPAAQFGFAARGLYPGEGDGNGVIEGNSTNGPGNNYGDQIGGGECAMFWSDLTYANGLNINFIEGTFKSVTPAGFQTVTASNIDLYFPAAKIGYGNYVYVHSGGPLRVTQPDSTNYFGLSAVTQITVPAWAGNTIASKPSIAVYMAQAIDQKIDDGLPQRGNVTANYYNNLITNQPLWAGTAISGMPYTTATPGSVSTCFDNGNVAGAPQQYSVEISSGNNMNCALSFRM